MVGFLLIKKIIHYSFLGSGLFTWYLINRSAHDSSANLDTGILVFLDNCLICLICSKGIVVVIYPLYLSSPKHFTSKNTIALEMAVVSSLKLYTAECKKRNNNKKNQQTIYCGCWILIVLTGIRYFCDFFTVMKKKRGLFLLLELGLP